MSDTARSILIAEDDPNDRLLIQRAFRRANLANPLQFVGDGVEACAYLAGDGEYADRARYPLPILLLLDIKMPRRSGLEVLAWLREQPGLRRLPVVVLTSSQESVDVQAAYELGANSYLLKPGSPDELLRIVQALDLYWAILNNPPELEA